MNTVDPNEKVAPPEESSNHHEVADAAPAVNNEPSVEASAHAEGDKNVAPENLPKYHHHRSTALW
jgi:hypothetical protein